MLKAFFSQRETNVAHAQGSRITGVSGEQGAGTRQALTAAFRSVRDQAACQPRTAHPAQHQPLLSLAAFGMISLSRYRSCLVSPVLAVNCIWGECWGAAMGWFPHPCGMSGGDVPVLAVGLGSSMCFQAESC